MWWQGETIEPKQLAGDTGGLAPKLSCKHGQPGNYRRRQAAGGDAGDEGKKRRPRVIFLRSAQKVGEAGLEWQEDPHEPSELCYG